MKTSFFLFLLMATLSACEESQKEDKQSKVVETSSTEQPLSPLDGAWELVGYYNYENDRIIDSFNQREGFRQVKMYSPTRVMWSKQVPTDSTEWFGYGHYKIEDGQLIEVLDYGSEMMTKIISEREEFRYDLLLTDSTFIQIEIDEDGNKIYSENYKRIE